MSKGIPKNTIQNPHGEAPFTPPPTNMKVVATFQTVGPFYNSITMRSPHDQKGAVPCKGHLSQDG
ncbi:hypothetical protein AB990_02935 [Alkalihalobacillus pseudalcaliphilus]|nr:hypothetical protein AB990_02935 [Alkalihalobacillus pseudalcaliphilus]